MFWRETSLFHNCFCHTVLHSSSTLIALLWLIVDMAHHQARIYFSSPLHSHTTAGIISLIIYWLLLYALVLPQERLVKAFKEHEPLLVEARIKICYDGCNLPAQGLQQHSQCHGSIAYPAAHSIQPTVQHFGHIRITCTHRHAVLELQQQGVL